MTPRASPSRPRSGMRISEVGPSPSSMYGIARLAGSKICVSATAGSPLAESRCCSDIEPEFDDVAVLHDVILALEAGFALRPRLEHRARGDEVVERDDLGLDEALLEVRVDHAGRGRRLPALADRPRAGLLRP